MLESLHSLSTWVISKNLHSDSWGKQDKSVDSKDMRLPRSRSLLTWHSRKCRVGPNLTVSAEPQLPRGEGSAPPTQHMEGGAQPTAAHGVVLIPCSRTQCLFEKENFHLRLCCMVYGQSMFYQLWHTGGQNATMVNMRNFW